MDCSHEKRVSNKSNCRRIFGWSDQSFEDKYLTTGKFPDFNEWKEKKKKSYLINWLMMRAPVRKHKNLLEILTTFTEAKFPRNPQSR
jgi:hypothetical protein